MLASRKRYLWWARQSRQQDSRLASDPSLFRELARSWRPVVKPKVKPESEVAPKRGSAWTPWLWIKP